MSDESKKIVKGVKIGVDGDIHYFESANDADLQRYITEINSSIGQLNETIANIYSAIDSINTQIEDIKTRINYDAEGQDDGPSSM